jgi:DNA topoisomerase-1
VAKLVVVESPAKARTIARFLGSDFVVESSIGHIRDLPRNASEVPAAMKGESWARLGVDVDHDFKPLYIVPKEKKAQVTRLKQLLKAADELYLATDEDREGESIAWHLLQVLEPGPNVPVKRMVFHEITAGAIRQAADEWRDLDQGLVDAQEARRILDRLYGYEVSPVLWRKVMPKLSAGRVQSVATRILVERERARMRFRSASYWDLQGTFTAASDESLPFPATLVALDGARLATGKDFSESAEVRGDVVVLDEVGATELAEALRPASFAVRSVEEKPYKRSPYPPFMTSTLQQEAGRKLRFSAQRTMQVAQRLYENGYITYMRTDSIALSETAVTAARAQARELYGAAYVPDQPRRYEKKVRNAQEAHEAIRPAGDTFRMPDDVANEVRDDEARLYDLVWKRTVASQMADARGRSVQVRLGAATTDGRDAEFAAGGKIIDFPGFLRAYVEGSDDPDAELEDREVRLPPLTADDPLRVLELDAAGHQTQPPARYTEASLVKALEEMGVGRPSTYASIIATILDRNYAWKKGAALVPSFLAFAVVQLMEQHFGNLVDYEFTARMEDELDEIARGEEDRVPWLRRFYFGNGTAGLQLMVHDQLDAIDPREVNSIPLGEDSDGNKIVVRVGRYGPYLQRGEDTASIPEDLPPDEVTIERAEELLSAPSAERELGTDPATGKVVQLRVGRFGPYVQLGSDDDGEKPARASLLKSMEPEKLTLEQALQVLSLPRTLGTIDDEDVVVQNGRYGPYVKHGDNTRTLESEDHLFTLTLDEARALLAQPKSRGRRQASAAGRSLGPDPVSGKDVTVRSGRFGPYVTDGEVNASLRGGDDPDEITIERAAELLQERRDRPGGATRTRKKAGAAKKAAKKTTAKKTAKKAAKTKKAR